MTREMVECSCQLLSWGERNSEPYYPCVLFRMRTLRWGPVLASRWGDMDPFKLCDENEQYNISKMKSLAMSIAFLLLSSSYFLFF